MSVADSGSMSHMVNILKNMTNLLEVKTAVKTGNKKIMTVSLQGKWCEESEFLRTHRGI